MLSADYLNVLGDDLVSMYADYELSVITDIARRLAKMGTVTSTAAWQAQRLTESGMLYESVVKELSKITGKSETELRRLFKDAGVRAIRYDDKIYKAAGLNPPPFNLSPAMTRVLMAGLQKTGGVINNMTMTTALDAQQKFINAADLAYMQVSQGAMGYQQAIRVAVKDIGASGLEIRYPNGHTDKLDVAMRRTVLTGVNQTAGKLQEVRADEMDSDLVQTSAHIGARPSHQIWQGLVFSRSGKKYPDFVESTGYGSGEGLCGWNCRHSFYPFFEGLSQSAYSDAELERYIDKTVVYNGQEMSFYDATQQQRAIERKIRYWKRQEEALKAANESAEQETARVRAWQATMRDFVKQTKIVRQRFREQI
jgi:hypothetical protein